MQRQQQALLSAQQSASALPATSPVQQQPPLAPSPIPLAAPVRMAAVQPGELTYRTAGEPSVLADWLFKVEQLLSQLGVSADAWEERLRVVSLHWDRQLDLWWQGHCQQARAAGTPVASWAAFRAALQANFVPTNDAEAAASELLRLRMRSGETMDAYMQRAALLLARSDGRLPGEAAARAALDGVDASRFPFTLSSARRLMRQAPAGSPLTFHAMRAELTASAVDEPQLGARGAASAAVHMSARPQGGSGSGGSTGHTGAGAARMTKQQLVQRVNALERVLHGGTGCDSETDEAEGPISAAPVSTRPSPSTGGGKRPSGQSRGAGSDAARGGFSGKCNKCGEPGHRATECVSSKELRSCLVCHQRGHLVAACPQVRRGAGGGNGGNGGDGPEGATRSKNE